MFERWNRWLAVAMMSTLVGACGGGSAGSSGGGTGGGAATYSVSVSVQRAGSSTTQISSTETVQAVARVTSSSGDPVEGVVVTFGETGATLLSFAPVSKTALSGSDGRASVDISAATSDSTGATNVTATASVAGVTVTSSRAISITAGGGGGTVAVPAAINFVGASPSGVAIVVEGAGGNGRSESAILTFRIVDANNAPINGTVVNFSINPTNGGATIEPTSATSNSDGQVTTTVSSGAQPASIVVTATSAVDSAVTVQSDTLIVSNSIPVAEGFEIVAAKYNLDGRTTGDSTTITAYVRDEFGNPVPDGVAVNFQTDYGVIASSTLGGCTTVNGQCEVEFRVQDPRGTGVATVIATVSDGTNTFVEQLIINMAGATSSSYIALNPANETPVTTLTLTSCKQAFELLLGDGSSPARAPAAGTTIAVGFTSTGLGVTVESGTPVLDQLAIDFPPVTFGIEVDLTSADVAPACNAAGPNTSTVAFFRLNYETANGVNFTQRIDLVYPTN
jgi:hypothetical protein